ncbi:peptide/nickel transport system ATP-binding protein [Pseudonocardia sediminis]|uniref:Peptide/nickel transport system ATP-binding protein n=1 Tax=Pseudonocardia sediminis TaxID=1397368 RepID=A0A4Q7UTA5_PSEST|nr:ABC transporter ATP-binding protein [Pseudonocardia sediminis]RZT84965.1 peptide/nickel transport system ATP-binding protein [Pseudonocardia sediminis]
MSAPKNATAILQVSDLEVTYRATGGRIHALRGIDLEVAPGEVVAVVGESGSGKSTLAQAVVGLLPVNGAVGAGTIRLAGDELTGLSEKALRTVRGRKVGLIPQDPTVSLNPVQKIGAQVAEALRVHGLADRRGARIKAVELLERAGLPEPATRAGQYPHELSGGMRQRVLIAVAIAADPGLLIADEPTSALDATVQRRILDHLDALRAETGSALLLITHDLAVAADRADRIVVMSGGRIVEQGPVDEILHRARDPYTRALIGAAPGLSATAAVPPPPPKEPDADSPSGPIAEVRNLVKDFRLPRAAGRRATLRAVDDVSFTIGRGETLALVGESGSGKSTTARLLLRLADPTSGEVIFDGDDITRVKGDAWRRLRRRAQLIYQNPYASLDPRFTVEQVITEPLQAFGVGSDAEQRERAAELVGRVALPSSVLQRRPVELSGGQRQRIAIARALALSPDLVVCDEPVSALDVSVQAQVLALLGELQAQGGLSYLFISHDLAVVRRIAHRVGVMRDGRLLELRPTEELFDAPREEYTRDLLAAIAGRGHSVSRAAVSRAAVSTAAVSEVVGG